MCFSASWLLLDLWDAVKAKECSPPSEPLAFTHDSWWICQENVFSVGQLWATKSYPRWKESLKPSPTRTDPEHDLSYKAINWWLRNMSAPYHVFPIKDACLGIKSLTFDAKINVIQYFRKDRWPIMHVNVSSFWLLLAPSVFVNLDFRLSSSQPPGAATSCKQ